MTALKLNDITLRVPEPEDVDILCQWENDSANWAISQTIIPFSRKIMKDYAGGVHDLMAQKQVRFMIVRRKEIVGSVDLFDYDPINSRAGIGILIDRSYRRQGIAGSVLQIIESYARDILFLRNLFANIQASSPDSIELFEKAGYRKSGVRKNWYRTPDGWTDEYNYILVITHGDSRKKSKK